MKEETKLKLDELTQGLSIEARDRVFKCFYALRVKLDIIFTKGHGYKWFTSKDIESVKVLSDLEGRLDNFAISSVKNKKRLSWVINDMMDTEHFANSGVSFFFNYRFQDFMRDARKKKIWFLSIPNVTPGCWRNGRIMPECRDDIDEERMCNGGKQINISASQYSAAEQAEIIHETITAAREIASENKLVGADVSLKIIELIAKGEDVGEQHSKYLGISKKKIPSAKHSAITRVKKRLVEKGIVTDSPKSPDNINKNERTKHIKSNQKHVSEQEREQIEIDNRKLTDNKDRKKKRRAFKQLAMTHQDYDSEPEPGPVISIDPRDYDKLQQNTPVIDVRPKGISTANKIRILRRETPRQFRHRLPAKSLKLPRWVSRRFDEKTPTLPDRGPNEKATDAVRNRPKRREEDAPDTEDA